MHQSRSFWDPKTPVLFRKAIDPFGDAILATTMNGEVLPSDHGFPVRVVVPGFAGVRNCKWLAKMELVDELHESHVDTHTDEAPVWVDMDFPFLDLP